MRFLAFGATMTLAAFLAANVLASFVVAAAAGMVLRHLPARPVHTRARLLLGLRLLPAAVAGGVALGLVMPAYVLLEPADADERVTWPLGLLALAALATLLHGLLRGVRAVSATGRIVRAWQMGAEPVAFPGSPVPVYRVRDGSPVFSLAGWRRPRLYVSARVLDALGEDEVAAAIAHEQAHLAAADNLRRLLVRSAPDLLVLSPAAGALEQAWSSAAEALADERAGGGDRRRTLALAAGLVKVARLAVPPCETSLPLSALHDGGDVEARVRRLVAGAAAGPLPARGGWRAPVIVAAAAMAGAFLAALSLPTVHAAIERAARLLR